MPNRKLLIVEDESLQYRSLCLFFESKGLIIVKNEAREAIDTYEEAVKLMKEQRPDIAVLDIGLKGEKNGIDLGIFIRQHYAIPVVYLSGKANAENLERIRKSGDDQFVVKTGKPLNKEQLWATVYLALRDAAAAPGPSVGDFLKVKEVEITIDKSLLRPFAKEPKDPIENEVLIKWEDITTIRAYNSKVADGNNNVLIHTALSDKGYVTRNSLDKLETQLPYYFARFNKSVIVNLKKATGRSRSKKELTYKIGDLNIEVADTYKKAVQGKITRLLNDPIHFIP